MQRASFMAVAILVACASLVPEQTLAESALWRELPPPPLAQHAAIFDPARNRMLVLAGQHLGLNGPVRVWSVTMTPSPQWTELRVLGPTPPYIPPRGAIYDPLRDRLILYCGYPSSGEDTTPRLWALDLSSTVASWSPLTAGGTPPSARTYHAAVYDPVRDRMLVFGGLIGGGGGGFLNYTNEVTALSLGGDLAWSTLSPSGSPPLGRGEHESIYDPVNDRLVVFGGRYQTGTITFQYLDETWALSLSGSPAWAFLAPGGVKPAGRMDCSAVFDPAASRMVIVGGRASSPTPFSDAWALDLLTAESAIWSPVTMVGGPPGRFGHTACVDPAGPRMLMYGGANYVAGGSSLILRTDLWSFTLAGAPSWTMLPNSTPPPRSVVEAAGAMDPLADRLLIFGGTDTGLHDYSSLTFARSLTDEQGWSVLPIDPATDSWRGQAGVFDVAGNRFVTYGGYRHNGVSWTTSDATLGLALGGGGWSPISPSGPGFRSLPTVLFDSARRRLMVFGGVVTLNGHSVVKSDAWALDLSGPPVWTPLPEMNFGGRYYMVGVYDPNRDRVLLMGGRDTVSRFDDVHALDLATGSWSALPVQGDTPPFATWPHLIEGDALFDASRDRVWCLMPLSGSSPSSPDSSFGLWALDFTSPAVWSRMSIEGRRPNARNGAVIVLDAARDRIVLHGGATQLGATNETWALYLDKTTPVALSLADLTVTSDHVRVRWYGEGETGTEICVFRRAAAGPWLPVGEPVVRSGSLIEFVDTDVRPGEKIGYRLGVPSRDGMRFFGETWVEIPRSLGFRLMGARPNPTGGAFRVELELPDAMPTTLELVDVAGRRRFAREIGGFGQGRHVIALGSAEPLAPGLYWVRLVRPGSTQASRVVVIR